VRKYIHHIERVKFAVTFYVTWTDKIGLVNVVNCNWLFKIRVLNALGNVWRFFLISPSRSPELSRYTKSLYKDLEKGGIREYLQDMKNLGGLSKDE
jgi:hypothetical protein